MIPWLSDTHYQFPSIDTALDEPNGLLAAGGDLCAERLINAYRNGIFPWYNDEEPILWWSPIPRCVLPLDALHISKSLAKTIRKNTYTVTFDQAFEQVIFQCSQARKDQEGTWINPQMQKAYTQLHNLDIAHSVEVWNHQELVGGLYGVAIGNIFFGESMFSRQSNTSKIGFCYLVNHLRKWGFRLIDCQVHNPHLASLGAIEIDRQLFSQYLSNIDNTATCAPEKQWQCSLNHHQIT